MPSRGNIVAYGLGIWLVPQDPLLANTVGPISNLPELLGGAVLFLILLAGATWLTLAPSRSLGAAITVMGCACLLGGMLVRVAQAEWQPESWMQLWTGWFYTLPLLPSFTCLLLIRAARTEPLGKSRRNQAVAAWLIPALIWLTIFTALFLAGSLPAHLS